MPYTPENMDLWTSTDPATGTENYAGERYDDYYMVYLTSRDADTVNQSNWDTMVQKLEDMESIWPELEDLVITPRASHWAVGWVEYLLVHKDAPDALLQEADAMVGAIADYPVLDEEDLSRREYEEIEQAYDTWGFDEIVGNLDEDFLDWIENTYPNKYEIFKDNLWDLFREGAEHTGSEVYFSTTGISNSEILSAGDLGPGVVKEYLSVAANEAVRSGTPPFWFGGSNQDWADILSLAKTDEIAHKAITLQPLMQHEIDYINERLKDDERWFNIDDFRTDTRDEINNIL
jgi:hypothetical protein